MYLLDRVVSRSGLLVLALAVGSWMAMALPKPAHSRVVVTETETTILDVVEFDPGTATLKPSSQPVLDAVAATLAGNPSIEQVEVQSHTCGTGDSAAHLALTQQRADAVMAYLVAAGVAPERLVAQGYGDTQPLDRAAPAKNERVSFMILKRLSDLEAQP